MSSELDESGDWLLTSVSRPQMGPMESHAESWLFLLGVLREALFLWLLELPVYYQPHGQAQGIQGWWARPPSLALASGVWFPCGYVGRGALQHGRFAFPPSPGRNDSEGWGGYGMGMRCVRNRIAIILMCVAVVLLFWYRVVPCGHCIHGSLGRALFSLPLFLSLFRIADCLPGHVLPSSVSLNLITDRD